MSPQEVRRIGWKKVSSRDRSDEVSIGIALLARWWSRRARSQLTKAMHTAWQLHQGDGMNLMVKDKTARKPRDDGRERPRSLRHDQQDAKTLKGAIALSHRVPCRRE
jgi:hypothetical protein